MEESQIRFARDVLSFLDGTELMINEDDELGASNSQMSSTRLTGTIEEQIQQLLIDQVNPVVATHGGVFSLQAEEVTDVYLVF